MITVALLLVFVTGLNGQTIPEKPGRMVGNWVTEEGLNAAFTMATKTAGQTKFDLNRHTVPAAEVVLRTNCSTVDPSVDSFLCGFSRSAIPEFTSQFPDHHLGATVEINQERPPSVNIYKGKNVTFAVNLHATIYVESGDLEKTLLAKADVIFAAGTTFEGLKPKITFDLERTKMENVTLFHSFEALTYAESLVESAFNGGVEHGALKVFESQMNHQVELYVEQYKNTSGRLMKNESIELMEGYMVFAADVNTDWNFSAPEKLGAKLKKLFG